MATASVPSKPEADNTQAHTGDDADSPSKEWLDALNEKLSRPVTYGQVWSRGWYLPQELALSEKARELLHDVPVEASALEMAEILAQGLD